MRKTTEVSMTEIYPVSKASDFTPVCMRCPQVQEANSQAGSISDFSSWGPAIDLTFKPNLAAPGSRNVRTIFIRSRSVLHVSLVRTP